MRVCFLSVAAITAMMAAGTAANALTRAVMNAGISAAVVKVHEDWRDANGVRVGRRDHRRHDANVVEAPFADVETGDRTVVDAPFTHVYVGRYGRHVVAPFVNLWIPR
jgi:hypothetical protein